MFDLGDLGKSKPGGLEKFIQDFGNVTEEYKFYDGAIKLRFDKTNHVYYRVDGDALVMVDGVTSVCHIIDKSHALMPWAVKMMEQSVAAEWEKFKEKNWHQYSGPQVIRDEFEKWLLETLAKGKVAHKAKVEEASDIGHQAHDALEKAINYALENNDGVVDLKIANMFYPSADLHDGKVRNCYTAAYHWMELHNVRWLLTERKIYSRFYEYAGTTDGLCKVSSCTNKKCCREMFVHRLSVADWKSSNYLYNEYRFQTAAYVQALYEELKYDIEDRWLLRLGKTDGKFEPWHLAGPEEYQEDLECFLDALSLTRSVRMLEDRLKAGRKAKKAAAKAAKQKPN